MALSLHRSGARSARRPRLFDRLVDNGPAQIALVGFALVCYLGLRIVVEGSADRAFANTEQLLALERALGIDWERSIQQWVLDDPGWVSFWNGVYTYLYWPSLGLALVLLWFVERSRYVVLRNALFLSAAIGIVIFALFPVAPPRFLPGYVDTLARDGMRAFTSDSPWANVYAAVPSFHVAWPALAGHVVSPVFRNPVLAALCYVPAMLIAGAVIVTGNHFLLDVVAGLVVVAVAHRAMGRALQPMVAPAVAPWPRA